MAGVFDKLAMVRRRIAEAASKVGRFSDSVDVMAVTKYATPAQVRELIASGEIRHIGENRVQHAAQVLPGPGGPEFHLIGSLQSNKAKKAAALFDWIDSIDRLDVAEKLDREAAALGKRLKVLVQVQPVPDPGRGGIQPEDLKGFVKALKQMKQLSVRGLMAIAPVTPTAEEARPHFRRMRQLFDSTFPRDATLSMGMSPDFEVAVEEGATLVRIGSLIFS